MTSKSSNRYPPELRERAVRMLLEHRSEYNSEHDAIRAIAPKIGCHSDTLRAWLRHYELVAAGGLSSDERQRLKELEREVRELRRSNDILRQASGSCIQCVDCNVQYLLFCAGIRWLKLM